jgi:predicted porin
MKKSLLALAVFGAFAGAAQAQSSVTIYGIIDTGVVYSSKAVNAAANGTGSKFELKSGVVQGSRLGFKGVEDLGGGLNAIFNLETGFSNDTGAQGVAGNLFNRKSVVGLGGGFGTVLVGRQTDFADTISAYTSIADFGGVTGNVGHNLDRLQGLRSNNSVSYTTTNLSGFTGNLFYGFGEQAGQTTAGQALGLGAKYENGPLGLGATYYQSKAGSTPADGSLAATSSTTAYGNTAIKSFNLVASYQVGAARVYGNWSRVKQPLATASAAPSGSGYITATQTGGTVTTYSNAWVIGGVNNNKTDVFELGTAYSLSPTLKLLASAQRSNLSYVGTTVKGKLTQFNVGSDYWLSTRTDLYAFVSNLRASNTFNPGVYGSSNTTGTDASQTAVSVGIRHKF